MSSGQSPVALVVEDDDQVRGFVSAVLEREGFTVLPARNAREGLQICRAHPDVRVLLADGETGDGITGIELAEILLKERPDLGVLVISGTPEIGSRAAERHLEFLQKPFMIRDFLQRLDKIMRPKLPVKSESGGRKKRTG